MEDGGQVCFPDANQLPALAAEGLAVAQPSLVGGSFERQWLDRLFGQELVVYLSLAPSVRVAQSLALGKVGIASLRLQPKAGEVLQ